MLKSSYFYGLSDLRDFDKRPSVVVGRIVVIRIIIEVPLQIDVGFFSTCLNICSFALLKRQIFFVELGGLHYDGSSNVDRLFLPKSGLS